MVNNQNPFLAYGQPAAQQGYVMPPNYPWFPTVAQPVMQGQQTQADRFVQQPQQPFDFVPVNDFEDVRGFYLQPNQRVWFRFQNDPIIALKFSNNAGVSETKYFKIEEFDPVGASAGAQAVPDGKFVTVEAFNEWCEKMENKFTAMIANGGGSSGKSAKQLSEQHATASQQSRK